MLFQINHDTRIEDLVIAGASVDGKITQQAALIKLGLRVPITFFFNSTIAEIKGDKLILAASFYAEIVKPYEDSPYEYQIRTEGINETDRTTDIFAETRVGLTKQNLEENLISILKDDDKIRDIVGLIQILPPKSLERNLVAGLAQIVTIDNKKHFYVSLHRGLATYLARTGTCDAIWDLPLEEVAKINQNPDADLAKYISFKPKSEILENIALNLKRFGIIALAKDLKPFGLKAPVRLPFNLSQSRIKKEYELTNQELSQQGYLSQIDNFKEILAKFKTDTIVHYVATKLNLELSGQMDLNTLLTCAGALYISLTGDEHNSAKNELLELIAGKDVKELFYRDVLQLIISEIPKIGKAILTSHLASFSVVANELTGKTDLILWDMPLDKALSLVSDRTTPKELFWVTAANEDLSGLETGDDIGIDLKVTENINSDLLTVLKKISAYPNIKNIYVKYSLLSHLATIIREHNFNVISI